MKRANHEKKICPIEKMISQDFSLDTKRVFYSRYCRFGLKTSNSNFKDFMASIISKSKAETEH